MHLTWSVEKNGRCPSCSGETILVVAFDEMKIDKGAEKTFQRQHYEESDAGVVDVSEEISGHFCPVCEKLTRISVNG